MYHTCSRSLRRLKSLKINYRWIEYFTSHYSDIVTEIVSDFVFEMFGFFIEMKKETAFRITWMEIFFCRKRQIQDVQFSTCNLLLCFSNWPIPASRLWPKKWEISLLYGYSSWYKHAINKFLIDNSASCSSQDIQVFEN